MSSRKLKVAIVGTGAVGGYYGIMLSKIGHEVHFLLRSDYEYVKENGLTLQSTVHGEIQVPHVNAYKHAKDMPIADLVIVSLKTEQNKPLLPEILPHITDSKSIVILVQNGLGMEEDLSSWLPNLQIAGATALILSHREKNGIIVHQGFGAINFGSYNLKDSALLDQLVQEFKSIHIPSSHQNLNELRWKKLVWNISFNGLSVVLDANTNVILAEHPERALKIMQEVIAAASGNGVEIPKSYAQDLIPFTEKMGSYAPSMRFDFLHKQALELTYLYAKPLAAGREAQISMPETEKLYQELQQYSR